MSGFRCGFCGVLASREVAHQLGGASHPEVNNAAQWDVLRCSNCGRWSLLIGNFLDGSKPSLMLIPPESIEPVDLAHVPIQIADDYAEAIRCLRAGANKAAAAMARRAVQSTCIHLLAGTEAKGPKALFDQIEALREAGEFTNRLERLAHRVRVFGNTGAHPGDDGLATVTPDEALETVEFLRHLLQHVFILAEDKGA